MPQTGETIQRQGMRGRRESAAGAARAPAPSSNVSHKGPSRSAAFPLALRTRESYCSDYGATVTATAHLLPESPCAATTRKHIGAALALWDRLSSLREARGMQNAVATTPAMATTKCKPKPPRPPAAVCV